jgi:hypothetical protein
MKTDPVSRLRLRLAGWQNQRRIDRLVQEIAQQAQPAPDQRPVIVMNVSSRLTGLSLNAAFSLLSAWSLRLAGVSVIHFVCGSGMRPCMLGTNREDFTTPPPCGPCIAQSQRFYAGARVRWWDFEPNRELVAALEGSGVTELSEVEFPLSPPVVLNGIPLGPLVLPSLRWALRRHTLPDDEPTRYLLRQYILSAHRVACEFAALVKGTQPAAAVIFNGTMYPEAVARWVARQMGVRVVTHEVGFQRFSVFFTEEEATAYPIHIPEDFELTPEQNAQLDANLEKRFQGKFTMAGIQFWPEMHGLDEAFLQKAAGFRQIVPVFTNVVYDTSQAHANVVFPHMFAWLDAILETIRSHPETLFVIRAHPDEMRPGTKKQSRESVHDWVHRNGVAGLANVIFIDSQEYISSYELIHRSKFVVVYNSSIGLEATLLGKAVLCGGQARYTQYPIVFFPQTVAGYSEQLEGFLAAEAMPVPAEFRRNARRFLYYQLFRVSIPLGDYLQAGQRPGFVQLRDFSLDALRPEKSPALKVIVDGILDRKPFLVEDRDGPAARG